MRIFPLSYDSFRRRATGILIISDAIDRVGTAGGRVGTPVPAPAPAITPSAPSEKLAVV